MSALGNMILTFEKCKKKQNTLALTVNNSAEVFEDEGVFFERDCFGCISGISRDTFLSALEEIEKVGYRMSRVNDHLLQQLLHRKNILDAIVKQYIDTL